jgi:hypothetical protein
MTKAKVKKTSKRPLRKAITTEDQGTVYPHTPKVYRHKPPKLPEDLFATAVNRLLESKIKDNFAIIRGIINLDDGFPSNDSIIQATNRHETDKADPRESLLNEVARRTITVSATYIPEIYTPMASHIRSPIERGIHHLNEVNNSNPRLAWNNLYLRDPGTSTLLFSFPVPANEAHMVQFRHLDFISGKRNCISCHIGISDGIRLQIYDEYSSKWLEVTYGKGDILLVRGDKFHRGTNYPGPDTKIRSFLYIEDEAYAKELEDSHHSDKGAVFCAGLKDINTWYKRQGKLEKENKATWSKEVVQSKKAKSKAALAKKAEALAAWRRDKAARTDTPQDPQPVEQSCV